MSEPVKYHLDVQYAAGLLGPVAASLRELERRLEHYQQHLRLAEDDGALLARVHGALAEARRTVEEALREGVARGAWQEVRH